MRILAFSDLHRDAAAARAIVDASRDADVVVGAGDFATQGVGASDTFSILRAISKPVVLVHGNHDDPDELAAFAEARTNRHYLNGSAITIGEVAFFGLGGEVPERNQAAWNAGLSEAKAGQLLAACPHDVVLVCHTPPLGHCDTQRDGTHEGSAAILACVERTRPSHVLCGHIHNSWGARSKVHSTLVHNVGPAAAWHIIGGRASRLSD
ncbi:MAG: metallophosphoesterase family protein [Pseudomonadota bacterium]